MMLHATETQLRASAKRLQAACRGHVLRGSMGRVPEVGGLTRALGTPISVGRLALSRGPRDTPARMARRGWRGDGR